MRDETRRRLDRALLAQKLKWAGLGVVAATALLSLFYIENLDNTVSSTRVVEATVVHVGPLTGQYKAAFAERNLQVEVKFDGVHVAHLIAPRTSAPEVGDRVLIADQTHGTGRHTYSWR